MKIITLLFIFMSGVTAHAACSPQASTIVKQCTDAVSNAQLASALISATAGQQASGSHIQMGANALQNASGQTSSQASTALSTCQAALNRCNSIACTPTTRTASERSKCTSEIGSLLTKIQAEIAQANAAKSSSVQTQSASASDGASLDSSTLMTALGAGLLGYMVAKQMSDDDDEDTSTSAITSTGALDCSADDAYRYTECDSNISATCYGNFSATDACSNFSARYCASTASAGSSVQLEGTTTYYTVDAQGTGIGSSYCQYYVAAAYCTSLSRNECPSCLLLSSFTSEACKNDPSLCLAQNTAEQTAKAKESCPTDPMFSNPSFAAYGTSASSLTSGSSTVVVTTQSISAASDVGTEMGPSLFSITSKAIRAKTKAR